MDGPGPKPIEEVAAERGGDAAAVEDGGAKSDAAAGPDGAGAAAAEGEKETSESKGSGEQYVKTTGLAADGGDFDATKPGAGREADRKFYPEDDAKYDKVFVITDISSCYFQTGLLEEKGIANPAAAAAASKKPEDTTTDTPESPDGGKEKKSLKEKIKAKLHKN